MRLAGALASEMGVHFVPGPACWSIMFMTLGAASSTMTARPPNVNRKGAIGAGLPGTKSKGAPQVLVAMSKRYRSKSCDGPVVALPMTSIVPGTKAACGSAMSGGVDEGAGSTSCQDPCVPHTCAAARGAEAAATAAAASAP